MEFVVLLVVFVIVFFGARFIKSRLDERSASLADAEFDDASVVTTPTAEDKIISDAQSHVPPETPSILYVGHPEQLPPVVATKQRKKPTSTPKPQASTKPKTTKPKGTKQGEKARTSRPKKAA